MKRLVVVSACAVLAFWQGASTVETRRASPQALVNAWTPTQSYINHAWGGTSVLLADGRVLVVGGAGEFNPVPNVGIYDPTTHSWSEASPMHTDRVVATATLLPNGRVLVAGGACCDTRWDSAQTSVEVYDPIANLWTDVPPMSVARVGHTATSLLDGRVLVVGGCSRLVFMWDGSPFTACPSAAEIFDAATSSWTPAGSIDVGREGHTATRLSDGRVLVAGGANVSGVRADAQIYDPATNSWSHVASLSSARYRATGVLMPNGRVLVAGGTDSQDQLSTTEMFDPGSGSWSAGQTLGVTGGLGNSIVAFPGGSILITAGGYNCQDLPPGAAEILDAAGQGWTATGPMNSFQWLGQAILLQNGEVLVAGADRCFGSAVLFNAASALVIQSSVTPAEYGRSVTLAATLYARGVPASGKTVQFVVHSIPVGTAITDASGVATLVDVNVSGIEIGDYEKGVVATFSGDAQVPSSVAASLLRIKPAVPTVDWGDLPPDVFYLTGSGNSFDPVALHWSASVPGTWSLDPGRCVRFVPSDEHYDSVVRCLGEGRTIEPNIATAASGPVARRGFDLGLLGRGTVDPVHNQVFMANRDGTIGVLDGTTNQMLAPISLHWEGFEDGAAFLLAIDPTRNRLYATDSFINDGNHHAKPYLWVVDTATRAVVGVGDMPFADYDTHPAVFAAFVINPSSGVGYLAGTPGLIAINPDSPAQPLATLDNIGGVISNLAIDPTTNLLYVAHTSDSNFFVRYVEIIDGDPLHGTFSQIIGRLSTDCGEWNIAVNPHTHRVYAVGEEWSNSTVAVCDGDPSHAAFRQRLSSIDLFGSDPYRQIAQPWPGVASLVVNPLTDIAYVVVLLKDAGDNIRGTALMGLDLSTNTVASWTRGPGTDLALNPQTRRIYGFCCDDRWGAPLTGHLIVFEDNPPVSGLTSNATVPVTVQTPPLAITFAAVSAAGETTIQQVDAAQLNLQAPGQFSLSDALSYEISTTATVTSPIQLCFNASHVDDEATFGTLTVLHGENGIWVDRTSLRDFPTRTICAMVNSLSPFAIARRTTPADTIAPTTTAIGLPADPWSRVAVTIALNAIDNAEGSGVKQIDFSLAGAQSGSGSVAGSAALINVTAEGVTTVSYYATDNAWNVEPVRTTTVHIDGTRPTVTISSPTQVTYRLNQSVTAQYSCADSGSGVASCNGTVSKGAALNTSAPGSATFNVTARDAAGNVTTIDVNYAVAYDVSLLYDPTKAVKGGSTIPIKLRIVDATGVNLSSASRVLHAVGVTLVGTTASAGTVVSSNANPDLDFRYDASLGGYIFNLSTKNLAVGSYVLTFVVSGDPTTHSVAFVIGK